MVYNYVVKLKKETLTLKHRKQIIHNRNMPSEFKDKLLSLTTT